LDMFSNPYGSTLPNPYDLRSNYGNSDFDFRNLLTVNFVYRLPWGRGQEFGSTWSRGVDAALGGWRTSGILTAHTGSPFTVTVPFDNANTGTSSQHGELVGNPKPSGFKQGQALWYDPTAFAVPTAYTYGDLGRNTLTPPGLVQFDFSLSKDFKFTESRYLQFRAESFNLTNRVNFGNPNSAVGGPNFMEIFGANTAREIQLALKLFF
jgi:hypothetical protein